MWSAVARTLRSLGRAPVFTASAILTLGLAIGADTAAYSVVDAILLEPLPYADPEKLVLVWDRMENGSLEKAPLPAPDVADLREIACTLDRVEATNNVAETTLLGPDGSAVQVKVASVTTGFLDVFGVEPLLGRAFVAADGVPPADDADAAPRPAPVVLSHGLWQRRFGSDPGVLGRQLRLGGPVEVVGVMPESFRLHLPAHAGMPSDVDAWVPFQIDFRTQPRDNQWLRVVARLAPGATLADARAELRGIAARHREESAFHRNMGIDLRVEPLHGDLVGAVRPLLRTLLGAVALVLLVACANVAQLLLVRARGRRAELAIQIALGARPGRIMARVLGEGLVLAVAGGLLGLALARLGIAALQTLRPPELPRLESIEIDGSVLLFTLAVSTLSTLVFAALPAWRAGRTEPRRALQGARALRSEGGRIGAAMAVVEVALSMVLLIGAGLLLQSFLHLLEVRPGFDPEGALTFRLRPADGDRDGRIRFHHEARATLSSLPGVREVGAVFPMPLGGRFWTGPYGGDDQPVEEWSRKEADFRVVLPGYFEAMGIRVEEGRGLEIPDDEERRAVAVVDRLLAAELWPGRPAVGERVGIDLFGEVIRLEVVGVVETVRHQSLTEPGRPTVYFPTHYFPWIAFTYVLRGSGGFEGLAEAAADRIAAVDPTAPVYAVEPLAATVARARAGARFAATAVAAFAVVALVLAVIGMWGVVASGVRQRTPEMGLRLALGARRRDVFRLVLGRGLLLGGAGIVLGWAGSLAFQRILAGLLHGVEPVEPRLWLFLSLLLLATLALALSGPALRASRVEPSRALRSD